MASKKEENAKVAASGKGSQNMPKQEKGKPALSEQNKQLLFAALAILAIGAAAYVFFLAEPPDNPSEDGRAFYYFVAGENKVGFLYDVRGADEKQISSIYQCGVDMISKGRFAGKTIFNIGCDENGCISTSSSANGSGSMDFEQAKRKLSGTPYFLVKPAETSAYKLFERHMEIYVGKDFVAANGTPLCDFSATLG